MKKPKKIAAINNQEDEDFEGFTLYPENAIDDPGLKKRIKKIKPNSEIKESVDIDRKPWLSIVRKDD